MDSFLSVKPQKVLIGDPVNIQVNRLQSGQKIKITVSGNDQFGNLWLSEASYITNESGNVDISHDAPVEGSYQGIDPSGLFWSMTCNQKSEMISPFVIMPELTISLSVDEKIKESQTLERIAFDNLERQVLNESITGVFFKPIEITKPTPVLIVLGGSEGGYNQGWAAVLASKTRLPVLALGYFGSKGLPRTLENIPLETFETAFHWLNSQSFVSKDHFGVIGASRGGELAILAASIFPQIKAVVGYTPSGVIWEGLGNNQSPAWTYLGKPFPYLLMMSDDESQRSFLRAQKTGDTYFDEPSFIYSLKMQQSRIAEVTIQAENSEAAFLLIGNPGDGVWPSQMLSQTVIDRLKQYNYGKSYKLLSYEEGGHMLIPYPYYPTTLRKFYLPTINIWEGLGGTAQGASKAANDSWMKLIKFLKDEL